MPCQYSIQFWEFKFAKKLMIIRPQPRLVWSGKSTRLPGHPPLRTVRESFPSYRSSLYKPVGGNASQRYLHNMNLEFSYLKGGGCTRYRSNVHLLFLPQKPSNSSRDERPGRSLLTFVRDHVSIPIWLITNQPSLFLPSSARSTIGLPYDKLSQRERYGFTKFRINNAVG